MIHSFAQSQVAARVNIEVASFQYYALTKSVGILLTLNLCHNHVPDFKAIQEPGLAQLPADYQELLVTVKLDGKPAQIQLDAIVADQGLRPELGELSISHSPVEGRNTARSALPSPSKSAGIGTSKKLGPPYD